MNRVSRGQPDFFFNNNRLTGIVEPEVRSTLRNIFSRSTTLAEPSLDRERIFKSVVKSLRSKGISCEVAIEDANGDKNF